jgi:hypothetical protein
MGTPGHVARTDGRVKDNLARWRKNIVGVIGPGAGRGRLVCAGLFVEPSLPGAGLKSASAVQPAVSILQNLLAILSDIG